MANIGLNLHISNVKKTVHYKHEVFNPNPNWLHFRGGISTECVTIKLPIYINQQVCMLLSTFLSTGL